jgi:transmembrane sensor
MQQKKIAASFRLATLMRKHWQGQLTDAESRELDDWINENETNRQLFTELNDAHMLSRELENFGKTDTAQGWQRLQDKIAARGQNMRGKQIPWKPGRMAAAIAILIVCTAGWLLHKGGGKQQKNPVTSSQYGEDVLPGTHKAELTLGNGKQLVLTASGDSVFTESGNTLRRSADGSLQYRKGRSSGAETIYNILRTPNGGEYALILEDGTKVWLNAASSLRYPVSFTGKQRQVALTGEAYFEIAKNKAKPFIVVAGTMQVQALGTAFNVNTYEKADSGRTATLVEGRIKVTAGNKTAFLQPGEQCTTSPAVNRITKADIEAVIAWKNGLFIFNNTPLREVLAQLTRWYDIKLAYSPACNTDKFFTGEIKRQVPISKVLQMLEMTGIARFTITKNTVSILPYTNETTPGKGTTF